MEEVVVLHQHCYLYLLPVQGRLYIYTTNDIYIYIYPFPHSPPPYTQLERNKFGQSTKVVLLIAEMSNKRRGWTHKSRVVVKTPMGLWW